MGSMVGVWGKESSNRLRCSGSGACMISSPSAGCASFVFLWLVFLAVSVCLVDVSFSAAIFWVVRIILCPSARLMLCMSFAAGCVIIRMSLSASTTGVVASSLLGLLSSSASPCCDSSITTPSLVAGLPRTMLCALLSTGRCGLVCRKLPAGPRRWEVVVLVFLWYLLLYLVMSRALVGCCSCGVAALLINLLPPVILVSLVMIVVVVVNVLTCGVSRFYITTW